jgi:hypothetical protein
MQNLLMDLRNQFEYLIGFTQGVDESYLLQAANAQVANLADFSAYMTKDKFYDAYPWARFGLSKDEYASTSSIYATEYKKVTGQDISSEALQEAFRNPRDRTGGLLSGSQYQQQLMHDANIQKTYGWVKYGLDFSAWTAQKLQSRTAFGRDIQDSEAATILQYAHASQGPNMGATVRQSGQQQPQAVGAAGSVVR